MAPLIRPILDEAGLELLRLALADYGVDAVQERLGPVGQAALSRGDLDGARRACRDVDRVATLTRLFALGCEIAEAAAVEALRPLPLERAVQAQLVERSACAVRAALDLRP